MVQDYSDNHPKKLYIFNSFAWAMVQTSELFISSNNFGVIENL